ncbi:MAG TPA: hypothetical protein VGY98_10380, partial [Verrucomicrobiae bacterium]|nr:hypothetical protein [Verrucomicrobiae bacterium]
VELCANQDFASFTAAWKHFCSRRGNFGPDHVNGRRLSLSRYSLERHLPPGCFAEFKRLWKTIRQAQRQIQLLRFNCTAEIRAHVPDRLPRQRVKRETDFQI